MSPRFVEWMQMLAEGWCTDVVRSEVLTRRNRFGPNRGVARGPLLRLYGNGVVPPQAAYALRGLLSRLAVDP